MQYVAMGSTESPICGRQSDGRISFEGKVPTASLKARLREQPKSQVIVETCAEAFRVAPSHRMSRSNTGTGRCEARLFTVRGNHLAAESTGDLAFLSRADEASCMLRRAWDEEASARTRGRREAATAFRADWIDRRAPAVLRRLAIDQCGVQHAD